MVRILTIMMMASLQAGGQLPPISGQRANFAERAPIHDFIAALNSREPQLSNASINAGIGPRLEKLALITQICVMTQVGIGERATSCGKGWFRIHSIPSLTGIVQINRGDATNSCEGYS